MKNVLLIGSGKSSTVLIGYILEQASLHDWMITVGDLDVETTKSKLKGHECGRAIFFDVHQPELLSLSVSEADLVISMLPASFHLPVLEQCIRHKVDFISASYVSDDIRKLEEDIKKAGILVLKECGLDPGIDHMSAMAKLDELRDSGATIKEFETFTGGLVAPGFENNPWKYKFTWNPRNVVLAGQGVVKFKHNGHFKYIPYHRLFHRYETLEVPGYGEFEGYPNRDSLKYSEAYGLSDVATLYRGTLRRPGFCKAWDVFVQLGMTDDSYQMEGIEHMTYRDFTNSFLWWDPMKSAELKLAAYLKFDYQNEILSKIEWLGLFEERPIGLKQATPAQVLQKILEEKWALGANDQDMIVMLHKYVYDLDGKTERVQASMVVKGEDRDRTAMAKTVGLPLGISAKLVLEGKLALKGIVIPTVREVYLPVLKELTRHGVIFEERNY